MSHQLISHSPDLKRLQDEGYEVEILSNHLLVHSVPYINSNGVIENGTLVSDLTLVGNVTTRPSTHVIHFIGEHPHRKMGGEITEIKHASNTNALTQDITIHHSFSNKPTTGYKDYYEKVTRYIEIISAHAKSLDPNVTACTFKVIESKDDDSPFVYQDTASSRVGISALSQRLAKSKNVQVLGLGGTGGYVLDLIAKTPIESIHLYDGDKFHQHNAFRAPGAASLDLLMSQPFKVDYFQSIYSNMHKGIVAHKEFITEDNLAKLDESDFVFMCIDKGSARKPIIEYLMKKSIPFIDVGMGIQVIEGTGELVGICRVTTSTAMKSDHISKRIPLFDNDDNDLYAQNIQTADLNSFNAAMAVMKWKKLCGFYQDIENEHNSTYSINVNQMTSDELS